MGIEVLKGKTLDKISRRDNKIIFTTSMGRQFKMYHEPESCESVEVEGIAGDLDDLIGSPIIVAHKTSHHLNTGLGSATYTFYHLATRQGSVTIQWRGCSNGQYSEGVDFVEIEAEFNALQEHEHED